MTTDIEEQTVVRVTPLQSSGQTSAPALLRWKVPEQTNSATITFIANITAGCHTNIKM